MSSLVCSRSSAAQDIQKLAEQAIRRLDLQTTLPSGPQPPQPLEFTLPPEALWIVIAIALAALAYAFGGLLPTWLRAGRGGAWRGGEDAAGAAAVLPSAATVGAADELARAGRYVEAMHVLLLQSLAGIRRGLDEEFADSLTSREILHTAKLPEAGRASLADIVERVEWTYFGRRPAAHADYLACRASFEALNRALRPA